MDGSRPPSALAGDIRAQSETLSVVLLLVVTITGVGAVVALGASAFESTQQTADLERAQLEMSQLAASTSVVAHGSADTQRAAFSATRGSLRLDEDAGHLRVEIRNGTTGAVEQTLLDERLGAVVYDRGETTVAYQGGGVWLTSDDGAESVVVASPPFHHRDETLTFEVVTVGGGSLTSGPLTVEQAGPTEDHYPNATNSNPLRGDDQLRLTVTSAYYRAWGQFLEERVGGNVTVHDANETVVVTVGTPDGEPPVDGAITMVADGDEVDMTGNGARTDSYDSSIGPYDVSKRDGGQIVTNGSFKIGGTAEVDGDVRAGKSVTVSSAAARIDGRAYWTTDFVNDSGGTVTGGDEQIDGVDTPDPVSSEVETRLDNLSAENDNADAPITTDGNSPDPGLDYGADDAVTLTPGDYYLNGIDANGKTITFDTDGRTITVGIENGVSQLKNTQIEVEDDGTVVFYVDGDVSIGQNTQVDVPGDDASQVWFYGTDGDSYDVGGQNTEVVGVFYAPNPGADFDVLQRGEIYGAVVASDTDVSQNAAVHFDESLRNEEPIGTETGPRLRYLHLSTTRVNVTG